MFESMCIWPQFAKLHPFCTSSTFCKLKLDLIHMQIQGKLERMCSSLSDANWGTNSTGRRLVIHSQCLTLSTCEHPRCLTQQSPIYLHIPTVMQLSYASLTTSYSISFHPFKDLSRLICLVWAKVAVTREISSSLFSANPEPRPPSAKAARTSTG